MTELVPPYRADQDSGDEQPIYTRHEWPHLPAPPPVINRFDGLRAAVVALRDQLDRETLPPVAITLALNTILEQFPPSLIPAGALGGAVEHHAILSGLLADKAQLETEVQRLQADKDRLLGALETALQEQDTLRAARDSRAIRRRRGGSLPPHLPGVATVLALRSATGDCDGLDCPGGAACRMIYFAIPAT